MFTCLVVWAPLSKWFYNKQIKILNCVYAHYFWTLEAAVSRFLQFIVCRNSAASPQKASESQVGLCGNEHQLYTLHISARSSSHREKSHIVKEFLGGELRSTLYSKTQAITEPIYCHCDQRLTNLGQTKISECAITRAGSGHNARLKSTNRTRANPAHISRYHHGDGET